MQINMNNPIISFKSVKLEDIERKENKKLNLILKLNLRKIKKELGCNAEWIYADRLNNIYFK
jgi:hypothetical protein